MSSKEHTEKELTNRLSIDTNKKKSGSEVAIDEQEKQQSFDLPKELNGPKGLEPTRYGDWESKGRCYDF